MGILSIKYVAGNKLALDTCRNIERPVIFLLHTCLKTLVLTGKLKTGQLVRIVNYYKRGPQKIII